MDFLPVPSGGPCGYVAWLGGQSPEVWGGRKGGTIRDKREEI